MNTRDKKIKRLAEKYYFGRYKITPKQREILENSKYSHLLGVERDYSEFNKILENFTEKAAIQSPDLAQEPVKSNKKYYMFHSNLAYIKDLLDEVEDAFFIGLDNMGLDRYKNIDINQLKTFIANYAKKHISDKTVLEEIKRILGKSTSWSILYNLRMLLTR
jgi:hypothetical protein